MPPAAVQRVAKGSSGAAASVTIAGADGWAVPTAGNLLVVSVNADATATAPTGAGTWSAGPSVVDNNACYVWYKIAAGTESSITCPVTTSADMVATVAEYSGVTASPFDAQNFSTITATNGSTTTAASVTTTAAGDLVLAFACLHNMTLSSHGVSPSWTNSFVNVMTVNSGLVSASPVRVNTFASELVVGAAGSYGTACSWTNDYANRQELIIAFKAAATAAVVRRPARRGPNYRR